MSIFKSFITSDVIVSPFKVNKSFTFKGNELTGSNVEIDRYLGKNITSSLWSSGSNPTGFINVQDQFLVYRSIRELYYSNYLFGSNGSPANTASFNIDGTITGPQYEPSYYNYLSTTLNPNRYFPTGSNDIIGVITIPSNLFGEYLKPGTVSISNGTNILTDDGEGNLISGSLKFGDVVYEHGMIILTNDGAPGLSGYGFGTYGSVLYDYNDVSFIKSFITSSNVTCSFKSTVTIYESQYKCTLRENEFNFSQNPTIVSGSTNSGIIYDFATGSYFSPYVTTVGLYNNNYELIAVGKLAQPLPTSAVTDTTILVNLDMLS
jgi:hypothetical protein